MPHIRMAAAPRLISLGLFAVAFLCSLITLFINPDRRAGQVLQPRLRLLGQLHPDHRGDGAVAHALPADRRPAAGRHEQPGAEHRRARAAGRHRRGQYGPSTACSRGRHGAGPQGSRPGQPPGATPPAPGGPAQPPGYGPSGQPPPLAAATARAYTRPDRGRGVVAPASAFLPGLRESAQGTLRSFDSIMWDEASERLVHDDLRPARRTPSRSAARPVRWGLPPPSGQPGGGYGPVHPAAAGGYGAPQGQPGGGYGTRPECPGVVTVHRRVSPAAGTARPGQPGGGTGAAGSARCAGTDSRPGRAVTARRRWLRRRSTSQGQPLRLGRHRPRRARADLLLLQLLHRRRPSQLPGSLGTSVTVRVGWATASSAGSACCSPCSARSPSRWPSSPRRSSCRCRCASSASACTCSGRSRRCSRCSSTRSTCRAAELGGCTIEPSIGHGFGYWATLILIIVGAVAAFLAFQQSGGNLATAFSGGSGQGGHGGHASGRAAGRRRGYGAPALRLAGRLRPAGSAARSPVARQQGGYGQPRRYGRRALPPPGRVRPVGSVGSVGSAGWLRPTGAVGPVRPVGSGLRRAGFDRLRGRRCAVSPPPPPRGRRPAARRAVRRSPTSRRPTGRRPAADAGAPTASRRASRPPAASRHCGTSRGSTSRAASRGSSPAAGAAGAVPARVHRLGAGRRAGPAGADPGRRPGEDSRTVADRRP